MTTVIKRERPQLTPTQQLSRNEQARMGGSFHNDSTSEAKWESLLERQCELEGNSMSEGSRRFRKRVADAIAGGQASTFGAAHKLLIEAIDPTEVAIQHMIDNSKPHGHGTRGGGRSHEAVRWCKAVGADVAAYMTAKVVLDVSSKKGQRFNVRDAALTISSLILDDLRFRKLKKKAPGLFNFRMKQFTTSSYAHKRRSLGATISYAEIDISELDMSTAQRIQVGAKLIGLFAEATSLVELLLDTSRYGKNERCIMQTPDTIEWLSKGNAWLEFRFPVLMPMVTPPLSWAPGVKGGYRFALREKFDLVRSVSEEHQKKIAVASMPLVYDALNRIQNTAWKINSDVMELVEAIQRKGGAIAGVPAFEDEPDAPKPFDIDVNDDARKEFRRKQHAVIERNHLRSIRAVAHTRLYSAAKSVANEARIWFPHNLDFRGRVYPLSNILSPQGEDLQRALLTFANAKPVGSEGGKWLAIYGVGLLGKNPKNGVERMSKLTLEERISWVNDNSDEICRNASDPFSYKLWSDAKKPFQFYAFAKEWQRYVESGRSMNFESSLPIAQDGTCSGIQHLSALLGDEIGGKAVNLTALDTPQDIYEDVANKVKEKLEEIAASEPLANKWLTLGLVDRDLAKQPVMTWGYGSEQFGFRTQIIEYLMGLENWPDIKAEFTDYDDDDDEDGKSRVEEAAWLLAKIISESLPDVSPAANKFKIWVKAEARKIAKLKRTVTWTTPTGLPVRQEYFGFTFKRVRAVLAGGIAYRPFDYTPTKEIDVKKQTSSVAPNFVHSLDSSALVLTVTCAASEGVEAFGMIHDSYATTAGDYSVLAHATRQSFIRLYTRRPMDTTEEDDASQAIMDVIWLCWAIRLRVDDLHSNPFAPPQRLTPLPIETLHKQLQELSCTGFRGHHP